jgi:non-ribosomal peptide synthetase component F
LRADLSGNPTFKAFLQQVRRTAAYAIAHQDYPFALLVEKLQPERDLSRLPLFQVSFVLQKPQRSEEIGQLLVAHQPKIQVNWGGLSLEPFELAQYEGLFDLNLEVIESKDCLLGAFKYNTDLFDASTIERMAAHFQNLQEGIVTNPEQSIAQLPILSPAERHQLLVEWNDTQTDYPKINLCTSCLKSKWNGPPTRSQLGLRGNS